MELYENHFMNYWKTSQQLERQNQIIGDNMFLDMNNITEKNEGSCVMSETISSIKMLD